MASAEDYIGAIESLKSSLAGQLGILFDRLRELEYQVNALQEELTTANLNRPALPPNLEGAGEDEVIKVEPDYSAAIAKLEEVSLVIKNWFPSLP
jgi:hypothetical protein